MNLLVLLSDSLRADHLGCYGNDWIQTPTLDALARESLVFDHATSQSGSTLSERFALFTGRYTFLDPGWRPIPPVYPTLAEILRAADYSTALISDTFPYWTPLNQVARALNDPQRDASRPTQLVHGYNYHRGFQHVQWIRGNDADVYVTDPNVQVDLSFFRQGSSDRPDRACWAEQYFRNRTAWEDEYDWPTARVTRAAEMWLREHCEYPFFLWVDYFDPHEPWDPPPPLNTLYYPDYTGRWLSYPDGGEVDALTPDELRHIRALYAGEVTFVDRWIEQIFRTLRSLDHWEDTLIVVLSDHGEPLGEHGFLRKVKPRPYEELLHIPLLIRHPDGLGAGQRTSVLAQAPDLLPTTLRWLGQDVPPTVQGKDLWAAVERGEDTERHGVRSLRPAACCALGGGVTGARTQEWKYIRYASAREDELYHLPTDPGERRNLIDQHPAQAAELRRLLEEFAGQVARG